jgi:hypothetical protein
VAAFFVALWFCVNVLLFLNSLSQNNGRNSLGDKKVPKIGTGGGEGDHEHNLRLVQPEETMMP